MNESDLLLQINITQGGRMRRYPLLFTIAFSACLSGCASSESGSGSNYELYEQTVNEDKLVTAGAARYLSRSVLKATSDAIKPGIYSPSEVARLLANACGDGGSAGAALIALSNNTIGGFEHVPEIGPFAKLPRELSYYETRNQDERNGPAYRPTGSVTNPGLRCPAPRQAIACDRSTPRALEVDPASAVKDLDYVVLISESEAQRCERLHDAATDLTRPGNHDGLQRAAIEENNKRAAELAAATFRSEDMPRLVQLLPRKYQGAAEPNADIPAVLQQEVNNIFATVLADARQSFTQRKIPDAAIGFSRHKPPESRRNGLFAWFRRPAPTAVEQVSVNPVLARAPFYLCYHDGAFQYVSTRHNLISYLSRKGNSGWRSLPRDEVISRAEGQLRNEAKYKQCLTSQFYFALSREIPGLLAKEEGRPAIAAEARADCFGYINTRRHTKFDLGVFSSLTLTGADGSAPDGVAKRRSLLDQLAAHFSNAALPPTGEDTMQFCGKWADERAVLVAQQPGR